MTRIPPRAVVFDLDDTLYLERDFAFSGFDAVARAFRDVLGDPIAAAARMRWWFDHGGRGRVFNELLAEHGAPAEGILELVPRMIHAYRSHAPNIRLLPESDDVLTRLRGRVGLGLISDGPAIMQRNKLRALGLGERFGHVILTDELGPGKGKPDTLAFEIMARELGAAPQECVYVADNLAKDFVAPNKLGWQSVWVRRTDGVYAGATAPDGGLPRLFITNLCELIELFGV